MIPHAHRLYQIVPRTTNPSSLAVFVAVAAAVNLLTYAVADQVELGDDGASSGGAATAYSSEQSATRVYAGVYSSVPPTNPALCPKFGCPILPRDIAFDKGAKEALESVRALEAATVTATSAAASTPEPASATAAAEGGSGGEAGEERRQLLLRAATGALDTLRSAGNDDHATLTLVGYKGGKMEDQTNQDRAFVVSPYRVALSSLPTDDDSGLGSSSSSSSKDDNPQDADARKGSGCQGRTGRLLGVFDGHGRGGEFVSDHTVTNLPDLLAAKLEEVAAAAAKEERGQCEENGDAIKTALFETFLEMDQTAPASVSGGCTATVVLQLGKHVYIANAGDSRSFLATYTRSTRKVNVIYASREDKPNLPDEKERVEKMGGRVYIPDGPGTSRVMYRERFSGSEYGLAMSRSIGDWDAGKVGVIPDPIVDAVNLETVLAEASRTTEEGVCAAGGGEEGVCTEGDGGDVEVFAVSATDGLLDYVTVEDIAEHIATGLYAESGPHPLVACEALIGAAAGGWHRAKKGRYRDDIAIAVSKLNF